MTVLALDLGTTTGWAIATDRGIGGGVMRFPQKARDTRGARLLRFYQWLVSMKGDPPPAMVVYELVRGHKAVLAAHAYAQFEGIVMLFCARHQIPIRAVHTGTLKKATTGKGNATKVEMVAAIRSLGYRPVDDNEADAIALALYVAGGPITASAAIEVSAIHPHAELPERPF